MTIAVQRCDACGTLNHPPRSLCRACLADALSEHDDPGTGRLLAAATLHRSFEPAQAAALPLTIGTVRLDSGPHGHVLVADGVAPGDAVAVQAGVNALGEPVWIARPAPRPA